MEALFQSVRVYPSGPLQGTIIPPSSKYHTLRYTLAAFLATGTSHVYYPAISDDSDVLLRACAQLGAEIRSDDASCLTIQGTGGNLHAPPRGTLDVGNAGAVLRLLLGICAVAPAPVTFTTPFPESLGRRPNADIARALASLGATVESQGNDGTLPITLFGNHMRGGEVRVSGKQSSQYISALLFLGPLLPDGLDIEIVDGLVSPSFIDLTIQVLREAGISIHTREPYARYSVPGQQHFQPRDYRVPGDYPSAAALLAAVAVAGGEITLPNLPQGDPDGEAILKIFSEMGLHITREGSGIHARALGPLCGVTFDGSSVIDSVPVIAAAACFATSPSYIYNVAHLRLKESDRIHDLALELNKAGCHVIPSADALAIHPVGREGSRNIKAGVTLEAHADHRLIQACTIAALGSKQPITIANAFHIAKSYPRFFDDLVKLGADIQPLIASSERTAQDRRG